ncbi:hypothetical protein S100390_v1c05400 [Spiroplasma sp. NBRC 100390]|uniref:hypothetical protein n=1 Tax=unclassified Spiroplasma TaxID=2637901 RepID=UPI0008928D7C|nr:MULTISPECIES: hypothetical protein [unclassified Spiroplasma]AOX43879.1 hypothetical protein STU14_v1c05400 [Spiroplasma sp. TU-14]APE13349.1 hypothetical protein S100390_v1c05400 [Spiroplasma sp. NBRC 100390]
MLGYKNILVGVGAIALATTPALVLSNSSNIHNKYNKIEKNIGQIEKQVLQYQTFYQNSKLNNALANVKNLKDGVNEWNYYFVYSHLYLNHSLTSTIQNDLGSVGGVVAALLGAIPEIAAVAGIVAAILIAQWYIWNIPSYDQGNGVGINLIGILPNVITSVWAQ